MGLTVTVKRLFCVRTAEAASLGLVGTIVPVRRQGALQRRNETPPCDLKGFIHRVRKSHEIHAG
jgi:hypothetical protein